MIHLIRCHFYPLFIDQIVLKRSNIFGRASHLKCNLNWNGIALEIGIFKIDNKRLSGRGQVVSLLAFYSVDPSSNPTKVYSFFELFEKERK